MLLIFCSLTLIGFSQEKARDKTFSVLFSPALLRAPETQWGLQTGVEYQWRDWSVDAEVALPFHKSYIALPFHKSYIDYAKINYIRLGMELKHYVYNDPLFKVYISMQNNYAFRQMIDTNGNTYSSKNPPGVFRFSKVPSHHPFFQRH